MTNLEISDRHFMIWPDWVAKLVPDRLHLFYFELNRIGYENNAKICLFDDLISTRLHTLLLGVCRMRFFLPDPVPNRGAQNPPDPVPDSGLFRIPVYSGTGFRYRIIPDTNIFRLPSKLPSFLPKR